MRVIGITGGVGAGKSAILDYIEANYSAKVLKADEIAHELMEPGTDCYEKLREVLPGDVFSADGRLNRAALAKQMFAQESLRSAINSIVHPAVKVYIIDIIKKERTKGTIEYLIVEAALLIEEHYDEICDQLWYIYTTEEKRKQRLIESRGYTAEKVEQIFASQLSEAEYRRHCQKVIDNNGSLSESLLQIEEALKEKGEAK